MTKAIKYPGVRVREHAGVSTIYIAFSFGKRECREVSPRPEPTQENLAWASKYRELIHQEIELGTFSYKTRFPQSRRASEVGRTESSPPVGDLLDDFLEDSKGLYPSTIHGYTKVIEGHLRRRFATLGVRDLTPEILRRFVQDLVRREIKGKTVRNILTPLRLVLAQAQNDGKIEINPFSRIDLDRLIRRPAIEDDDEDEGDVDPFTAAEIDRLVAVCPWPSLANGVRFWFSTGLRPSEFFALERDCVDLQNGTVRVKRALVRHELKPPKTLAGRRTIELLEPARAALTAQFALGHPGHDYVFWSDKTGEPWMTDSQFRRTAWLPLMELALGVRYRPAKQLRHSFGSALISAGVDPLWVSAQLGHKTLAMTLRHYARAARGSGNRQTLEAAAKALGSPGALGGATSFQLQPAPPVPILTLVKGGEAA